MWSRTEYLIGKLDVPEQHSPDGEWLAGVYDNNVVMRSTRDGRSHSLTHDGVAERFWDLESTRWRDLPGLRVRFNVVSPWSPDSLALVAYRRDTREVFRMPRVNWLQPFESVDFIPYQKAGARIDRVQPVFVELRSGRQTAVQLEQIEDRYIQLLAWYPHGSEALLIIYTRDFKRVDIVAADRETGAVRPILTESSNTWVKIQHEAMFSGEHGFRLLPDNGFLWLSTRDGWHHLYRYDSKGHLVAQLTAGAWSVYDIAHVGDDGFVYFTAAIDETRPYDVHVCRIRVEGGPVEQLTQGKGIHGPTFAPNGKAFLDTHSAVDRPQRTDLVKSDGTVLRTVAQMDITRLKEVGYLPPEEFTVKAADGVADLWGVMYKPFDFDPARSYPVIEYIYGGPQMIEAQRFFVVEQSRFPNLIWALAQLGYIVVCLDARGTPGRSKAFHEAVYRDWTVGIADHASAIRQLCGRHSWMDASRVGITGHSWGGYFSTCALIQAPEVYRAAVSYEPGYDPWDLIIYEPYLGLPQKDRSAYERADLFRQVGQLRGQLMIVAGTSDHYVFNSAMRMTRALIDAGIDHEFVVVPNAFHHFIGADEDYLLEKLTGWFERHLKDKEDAR